MNNIGSFFFVLGLGTILVSGVFLGNGDLSGCSRKVRRGVWSLFGACACLIISKFFEP